MDDGGHRPWRRDQRQSGRLRPLRLGRAVPKVSPIIHIKQSLIDKGGHRPFTAAFNARGSIQPQPLLSAAFAEGGARDNEICLAVLVQGARAERPRGDPADRRERRLLGALDRDGRRRPRGLRAVWERDSEGSRFRGLAWGKAGMGRDAVTADMESSLAIRAVLLHYAGGLTQAAVAERLGIPSVKAHRLIARAVAEGAVKVTIDGDILECIDLEERLAARFRLGFCEVAPDLGETGLPLRTLGVAGASFLRREIERGEHRVIGLGHGRTLAAAVRQLPRLDPRGVRFCRCSAGSPATIPPTPTT